MAYPVAVSPAGGQRTWTVLGEDFATVGPVEEWIEAHRHLWSPNTVRGYANLVGAVVDLPGAAWAYRRLV